MLQSLCSPSNFQELCFAIQPIICTPTMIRCVLCVLATALRLQMTPVDVCFNESMTVRIPITKTGMHQDNFTVNIIATDGTAEGISIAFWTHYRCFKVHELVFGLMVRTEPHWYTTPPHTNIVLGPLVIVNNYVSLWFITEEVDFHLRQTTVTFTPSDQVIDIEIDILPDGIIDTNERFNVSIAIPLDEPFRSRITIGTPSTISIDISCDEIPRSPSCNVSTDESPLCDTDFAELQCIHSFPGPVVYRWVGVITSYLHSWNAHLYSDHYKEVASCCI